jgi:AraC family transcriptional regulator
MSYHQTVEPSLTPPKNWNIGASALPGGIERAIEARRLLEDVRAALGHDLGAAIRAAAHLEVLLRSDTSETPVACPAHGGLAPWQKRKIRDYIGRHLDGPIHVQDLAKLASLSAGHFSRAFKESFGATPHAYIVQMRLERAREMMLATPDSLSQIALACGHSDQAHFSRRFRQQMGETPNAWRRRHAMGDWAAARRETEAPTRDSLAADQVAWADAAD